MNPTNSLNLSGLAQAQKTGGIKPATQTTMGVQQTPSYINNATASQPKPATNTVTGNGSIVDYLNKSGQASDYNSRAKLAQQQGISNYTGTAEQNTQLLGSLNKGSQPTNTMASVEKQLNSPGVSQISGPSTNNNNSMNLVQAGAGLGSPQGSPAALTGLLNKLAPNTSGSTGFTSGTQTTAPTFQTDPAFSAFQQSSQNPPQQTQTTQTTQTNPVQSDPTYRNYVNELAKQAQMTDAERNLMQQQADLKNQLAQQTGLEQRNPIPLEFQVGRIAALQNMANAQGQNIAEQTQTYTEQRKAAADALARAAQFAKPEAISYSTQLTNPLTGQATDPNAAPYQGLTNFSIAQNNISQGNSFAQQAGSVSNGLGMIRNLEPRVVSFLEQSGLNNTGSPIANQSFKAYAAEANNPQNVASLNAMLGEVRSSAGQLLLSSGLNPTDVSNTLNSFDFSDLSPNQLKVFLQNLEVMGNSRLQALQESSRGAYGANTAPGTSFAGQNVSNIGQFNTTPNNAQNNLLNPFTDPAAQTVAGAGLNLIGGATGMLQSLIGGAAGGGIVGAASRLFK